MTRCPMCDAPLGWPLVTGSHAYERCARCPFNRRTRRDDVARLFAPTTVEGQPVAMIIDQVEGVVMISAECRPRRRSGKEADESFRGARRARSLARRAQWRRA